MIAVAGWFPPPPTPGGPIHPPFPPNPPPDYAEMIARLDALERGMKELGLLPAAIGHNRPPEDEVLGPEDRTEIANAITTLKSQPPEPATQPPEAINAVERLKSAALKVGAYLAAKGDLLVEELVKSVGAGLGKSVVKWAALYFLLHRALDAAMNWLQGLPPTP